jgi:rSAM/selenodomain-associated transferase 1
MKKNVVIIFLKYPRPGKVKTRISGKIGNAKAVRIYKTMATRITGNIGRPNPHYASQLFVDIKAGVPYVKRWLKPERPLLLQKGKGLGKRMDNAFRLVFRKQFEKALLVGTDVPALNRGLIRKAFSALEKTDAVIGPAMDGGYYLIGLKRPCPALFSDIPWSTPRVLPLTLKRLKQQGMSYVLLRPLRDVDTVEDLKYENLSGYSRL